MPGPPLADESTDLVGILSVLKRRGWIVLACFIMAPGAAYAYAKAAGSALRGVHVLLLRDTAPVSTPANPQFDKPTPKTAPDREALILSEPVKARAGNIAYRKVASTELSWIRRAQRVAQRALDQL